MKVTSTAMKNEFGKYLRLCANEPIYITKNGKTIAKLMNHNERDEIIEDSVNLRKLYHVDEYEHRDYPADIVAESAESYNQSPFEMTLDEFNAMNMDATKRYEYIDGRIYMLASPNVYHQRIISKLHVALDKFLTDKPCDTFESPFDVTLLRRGDEKFTNIVQPDLLVICDWRKDLDDKGKYMGIPRLVVEVLSPNNTVKETMTKLDLYRDSGIEEYWVIDPNTHMVLIYAFEGYSIKKVAPYSKGTTCKSYIYDGFEIEMDVLIED